MPKGINVAVSFYKIHRDPDNWDNPEEFLPERFENYDNKDKTYLPFGGGRRICIGKTLALLELYTISAMVVKNFKFSLSDEKQKIWPIPFIHKFTLQPLPFKINVEKRNKN